MFRTPVRQRRCWSLSLIAVLLLHWTLGIDDVLANLICIEADGKVALEYAGEHCHESAELQTDKSCIDFKAGDHHDAHDSLRSGSQLADLPPVFPVPALPQAVSEPSNTALTLPLATGPPLPSRSVVLRKTTVLLI